MLKSVGDLWSSGALKTGVGDEVLVVKPIG